MFDLVFLPCKIHEMLKVLNRAPVNSEADLLKHHLGKKKELHHKVRMSTREYLEVEVQCFRRKGCSSWVFPPFLLLLFKIFQPMRDTKVKDNKEGKAWSHTKEGFDFDFLENICGQGLCTEENLRASEADKNVWVHV